MKWVVNPASQMIHSTSESNDFPQTKRENHTFCGKSLEKMIPYRGRISTEPQFRFCIKCQDLEGSIS